MKKVVVIVLALSLMMVGSAFAAGKAQTNAGCGLGTMLWKNNADESSVADHAGHDQHVYVYHDVRITSGPQSARSPRTSPATNA